MENVESKKPEQIIVLNNRENLSVSGTNKIISLKENLIQLDTNFGGLIITGNKLELIKLDNNTTRAEIKGNIDELKFLEIKQKENIFRKIFK